MSDFQIPNMAGNFTRKFQENANIYKKALDSIIDKYSSLQYEDGEVELDLDVVNDRELHRHMRKARKKLDDLAAKSSAVLTEGSARANDGTGISQLDVTYQSSEADDTQSSSLCSGDDHGRHSSDSSRMTACSINECVPNLSVTELQPQDQDDQLEMTFGEQSSYVVEQYPSMISRLNKAWDRQNASEAADSVVRRYRRWRQQSNRSNLKKTSGTHSKGKNLNKVRKRDEVQSEAPHSTLSLETTPPVKNQQQTPEKQRGSVRSRERQPVLALYLSAQNESFEPRDVSLHRTLTMSPFPQTNSPSKHDYQPVKSSMDWIHKSRDHSPSALSEKTTRPLVYADQQSVVKDRSSVSRLLVKQSPIKLSGATNGVIASPSAFSRRKETSVDAFFREPSWSRSRCPLSSPQKSAVPLRMIEPQNSPLFFSPHLKPPSRNRPRFQRSLSFDSSSPSTISPPSPEKIDMDFQKLYHRYACEKKYFTNGPPCSLCTRGPQASRFQSALALSPRSLVWRKRHREQGREGHPQSKRVRNACSTSSPGSRRYEKEMLRRHHSQSELSGQDLSSSRYRFQQCSPNGHQENSISQEQSNVNHTFLSSGASLEGNMGNRYYSAY